ncbi:MAG: carboxypeptidase-like regulatory domain-containing protein, partial [Bacteroidetes bacterium]|nr:carboxypeptidase-like regulatory domain-containing protein [Bacteroidota bacterium]
MNLGKTFFFAVFLFFSLTAVAQVNSQLKITENFKGLSLDQVLDTLRQKYELNFAFDPQQAQLYTINQSFRNQTVEKVMESLLKNTPYRYEVSDNVILLVPQPGKLEVPKALHLQGRIVDEASGEPLPYAHISALGTTQGELSNIDGYFSLIDLDNPTGFKISYLGYQSKQLNLEDLDKADVEIKLQKEPQVLKELVVGDEINSMVQIAGTPSTFSVDPRKLNAIPVLGEADVMRSLQLLPGISATEETSAGLIVRGGTTDQNLVLFDGFTVYHLDHFYGIFSAFNPHSVKNIRVIKGGFDAKYGGRASSVVEIIGKSGDRFKPHAGFGLNLISANVYAEIPIGKKASFIFSGRRSFTDIIQTKLYQDLMDNVRTNNIQKETNDAPADPLTLEPDFYFYDFNTKFSYNPSHKDILAFSFYNGQDQLLTDNQQVSDLKLDITDQSKWGNRGMSGRWGRQWNKSYYSNLILSHSIFRSEANFDFLQLTDANDTISI